MTTLKIGISGKRHFKNGSNEEQVKNQIREAIQNFLNHSGQTAFIGLSMLATGTDSIFASLVLDEFKQPLHIVLPFEKDEFEKELNGKEKAVFEDLFTRASARTNLKVKLSEDAVQKKTDRNRGFQEAGRKIANDADFMVFVWDERKPSGEGGTADILSYFSESNTPDKFRLIKTPPRKESGLQYRLDQKYHEANAVSIQFRRAHNKVWKRSILLGWLAVGIFSAKTAFGIDSLPGYLLTILETTLIVYVAIIVYNGTQKAFHKNFLKQRIIAEQLRVLRRYFQIGANVDIPIFAERTDKELSKFVDDINQESQSPAYSSIWYSNYIIKKLINDQIVYHQEKIKTIGSKPENFEKLKIAVAILFFINLIGHAVFATGHQFHFLEEPPAWLEHLSTALSIFLPATYAAVEGILSFKDWGKIKNHSEFVKKNLEKIETPIPTDLEKIDPVVCIEQQKKLLKEISTTMLNDNNNWQIMVEDKSNYHWII